MSELKNIMVVPYDPTWTEMLQQEAFKIVKIFGSELISIHHIGSTAIPGLSGKPIIDILLVVRNIDKVETFNSVMIQWGYEPQGEYGIPGRYLFFKGGDTRRTHHVHTYEPSHSEVTKLLDFRDYLIAHPQEIQRYGSLKAELAQQFPHDISGYRAGKSPFITEINRKAHEWRATQIQ